MTETQIKEKVKELLDKYDLEGLLKMGCPKDEYDPEARKITTLILGRYTLPKKNITEKNLCEIVANVFNKQFGELGAHKPTDKKVISLAKEYKKWEKKSSKDSSVQ
jgi:hypothetical protein